MGLFSKFFGSKTEELSPFDLSTFGVDMHSHLIPGIDDGSRSMDETVTLLAKFESMGYRKVITTPHIMSDYYKNTPEIILEGAEHIRNIARQLKLKIEIEAAAEYYYDESLLARLQQKEKLLTFGDNYVLFEFSFHSEPNHLETLFFEFFTQNYRPILAHVERYPYLIGSVQKIREWREKGILMQLNLNSITGHYGPDVQKQARVLIDEGLIDFVGSDCHRIEHLLMIEKHLTLPYFHKLKQLPLRNASL